MYARIAAIKRQGLFIVLEGLVKFVSLFVDIAQVVPGVSQSRVQQDRLLAMRIG